MSATLTPLPTVAVGLPVRTGLCRLAFDVFTSRPGEGARMDGVLLGRCGELQSFLQDAEKNDDPSLERMGFWSVQRRLCPSWDQADDPLLPPGGVYLVVAPGTFQRSEALLWQRPEPGAEPVARRLALRSETPVPKRAVRRPELKPPPARRWPWAASVAFTLILGLWLASSLLPSAEVFADTATPRLTLDLHSTPDGLELTWREIGAVASARVESAVLSVRQHGQLRRVDLSDQFRPEGHLLLGADGHDLVVNLRLRRADQPLVEQTVTYVVPLRKQTGRKHSVP